MNSLSKVFVFKIAATILAWCLPLLLMPGTWIEAAGFPSQETYMFIRMLGWAYLALCVGYCFGLRASLEGKRALGLLIFGAWGEGETA